MNADPSSLSVEEYRALRATIRERGSLRLLVIALTILAWAIFAVLVLRGGRLPGLTLLPLLVLATGFEVVFAAHVGVERIGRYLQTRYESATDGPCWERSTMALSRAGLASGGVDPLAARLFLAAMVLNLVPVLLWMSVTPPAPLVLGIGGVEILAHVLFAGRVASASRFAAGQRAADLEAFERLLGRSSS